MRYGDIHDMIIDRLSGNISASHQEQLENIMETDSEIAAEVDEMANVIDAYRLTAFEKSIDEYQAWEKIEHLLFEPPVPVFVDTTTPKKINHNWRRWMAAAAIFIPFIVLLSVGISYLHNNKSSSFAITPTCYIRLSNGLYFNLPGNTTFYLDANGALKDSFGHTLISAATLTQNNQMVVPVGQRCALHLNDGTMIILNSVSTFSFPSQFNSNERSVALNGEGYFKVAHDSRHPFIVNTNTTKVRVLGTVFTVKAYPNEKEAIALISGSVTVASKNEENKIVQLSPGETVEVANTNFAKNTSPAVTEPEWINGLYYFNKERLADIISVLERWYNVTIAVEPYLAGRTFSGAVEQHQPINTFLEMLSTSSGNIKYKVEGNNISIFSVGSPFSN